MGKMKIIKLLVLGSIFSLLFTSCLFSHFLYYGYKHFYKVGNMEFTFWKTKNGCYIMPYKYTGLTIPKNDYMIASSIGGVVIFIGEGSTLYIFPNYTYERGAETIEINLTSYKFEYFPYINEIDAKRADSDKRRSFYDLGYPFINISLRDWYVIGHR
jgi:hypothetical protein